MKINRYAWLLLLSLVLASAVFNAVAFAGTTPGAATEKNKMNKVTYPDNMFDLRYHDVGQLYLPITNYGIHGLEIAGGAAGGIWPKGSAQAYIFGAGIWIGANMDGNKNVSCGYNPNSGSSELVPGWVLDPDHNYTTVTDPGTGEVYTPQNVRMLMSTDYPYQIEELELPEWPFGYFNPITGDTVATWAEAGDGYQPVTISVQDSYAQFSDVDQTYKFDSNADINHIFITQTGYAWNYSFNQDFLFLTWDIEYRNPEPGNAALDTLQGVYLAVVCDPDIGNADDDMVGFDEAHNMAYTYDFDGNEADWATAPGYLGYDFLESPINPATGEQVGLTAFRIFTIDVDPGTDVERYDVIAEDGAFDEDTSPADKRFAMPTGPFDLPTGEPKRVVAAMICASNFESLIASSELAQSMYDLGWVSPAPPPQPVVSWVPGAGKITLYWDDVAETTPDPVSGEIDFEGYRVYKSRTGVGPLGDWDVADPTSEWQLIAQYDLADGITNVGSVNVLDAYNSDHPDAKYLGDDTGLVHSYVDEEVIDGVEYHYAVTSYDRGTLVVRSLESGLILGKNRVLATPGLTTLGYEEPTVVEVTHVTGRATAELPEVTIVDWQLVQDETYTITFDDSTYDELRVTIVNSSGEVLVDNSDHIEEEGYNTFDGLDVFVNVESAIGLKEAIWTDETRVAGSSDCSWEFEATTFIDPRPDIYEIRFVSDPSEYTQCTYPPTITLPFQIVNTETGEIARVSIFSQATTDTTDEMRNTWTSGDPLRVIEEYQGSPFKITWEMVLIRPDSGEVVDYEPGDILRVIPATDISSEDVYSFTTQASDAVVTSEAALSDIKVVPNPYIVRNVWEVSPDYAKIMFTHLPENCTIRIYTMAGDLITTLIHGDAEDEGPGYEWWDLLTENEQKLVSGIYIYYVEAPGIGERVDKFAVIR